MKEMQQAGRRIYSELKSLCVWAKDNAGMGSLYRSQHELVFVFKNGKVSHRNNVQLGQYGRTARMCGTIRESIPFHEPQRKETYSSYTRL